MDEKDLVNTLQPIEVQVLIECSSHCIVGLPVFHVLYALTVWYGRIAVGIGRLNLMLDKAHW